MAQDKAYVIVEAKNLKTGETVEIVGDLLIAADGCMSEIRRSFLPDLQLRLVNYLFCVVGHVSLFFFFFSLNGCFLRSFFRSGQNCMTFFVA